MRRIPPPISVSILFFHLPLIELKVVSQLKCPANDLLVERGCCNELKVFASLWLA